MGAAHDRAPLERDAGFDRGSRSERPLRVDDRRPLTRGGGGRGELERDGRRPRAP